MQQSPVNSPIRIDLSDKTSDEITVYLQALLAARYSLSKKGFKLKITRSARPPKVKITSA